MMQIPVTPERKRAWTLVIIYIVLGVMVLVGIAVKTLSGGDEPDITDCMIAQAWLDEEPTLEQLADVETYC